MGMGQIWRNPCTILHLCCGSLWKINWNLKPVSHFSNGHEFPWAGLCAARSTWSLFPLNLGETRNGKTRQIQTSKMRFQKRESESERKRERERERERRVHFICIHVWLLKKKMFFYHKFQMENSEKREHF